MGRGQKFHISRTNLVLGSCTKLLSHSGAQQWSYSQIPMAFILVSSLTVLCHLRKKSPNHPVFSVFKWNECWCHVKNKLARLNQVAEIKPATNEELLLLGLVICFFFSVVKDDIEDSHQRQLDLTLSYTIFSI